MADFGIKVGSNLNTNTDLQVKLSTKFSSLKLYKWKDASITTNGSGNGSATVSHDLGYTPVVQVWVEHTAQFSFLSGTTYPNSYSLVDSINSYRSFNREIQYSPSDTEITITATGAAASTTYNFRVLIWVDKSESFSGTSTIALDDDYGVKISESGINVFTGQEYQMQYSSKYRAIQYYEGHIQSSSLTLPAMWASRYDTEVQEAVYVDFNHNLGYPPLFFVFSDLGTSYQYECPYYEVQQSGPNVTGLYEISAWCDASRIRVLFHRKSNWFTGGAVTTFAAATISITTLITTENLARMEN